MQLQIENLRAGLESLSDSISHLMNEETVDPDVLGVLSEMSEYLSLTMALFEDVEDLYSDNEFIINEYVESLFPL